MMIKPEILSLPMSLCLLVGVVGFSSQLQAQCPGEELSLSIQTDNNGNETTWAVYPAGSATAICAGGPYASNTFLIESCCVPNGCYRLEVYDSMGDGMFSGLPGGYALFDEPTLPGLGGSRIIDNTADGQFGSISTLINNNAFCVPLGNDQIKAQSCDKLNYDVDDFIVVETNPLVSAEFGIGDQTDDGFQYWIFDPDGTYSRRILRTHANPSPGAQPGPTAVNFLRINSFSTLPVPQGIQLNVRVRSLVNGVYAPFGPACVMKVDQAAANDPCKFSKLIDDPTSQYFSCGVQREWGVGDYVAAKPVTGANKYQFFYTDNNGYNRFIAHNSYFSNLGWGTLPLIPGTTYFVSVRISFDNGVNYCPFGQVCTLEITVPPAAFTTREMENLEESDFIVYPNPVRGSEVYVKLTGINSEIETGVLHVTDMFGKEIVSEQIVISGPEFNQMIPISSDLAQGMYLVSVQLGEETFVERLIVQ